MAQIINNDHGSWWWQAESNNELTLAVITILVLILLLYKFLISSSSSSLSPFPPGPLSLPIVGYLPSLFSRDLHRQFTNMANTYGPVFKVKVGKTLFVVVNTPDVAKTVLRDHDEVFTHCKATVARSIISYGGQNIVHSNHLYWRKLRNILTHEVISHKSLEACSSFRRDEVRKTIKNIFNEMMGATVDMAKVSFVTEARIMSRVLWENTSDELGVKDSHFGDQLGILSAEISEIGARPNLSDLLPSLARFDPQGIERDMKEQFKRLDKIFSTIIDDRIKSNAASLEQADGKKDFLQVLLDLKDSKSLTLSQAKTLLAVII
uniref:carnosic acid synthase-like n=1 Tax=Erigeron canadensis TaxID=72917 RepID=UPI001CB97ECC|nr:carnosic acid synthase-like [Erigeron canadensis]